MGAVPGKYDESDKRNGVLADILIIDDDLILSDMLVEQMMRVGHKAETANTLADGLEKSGNGAFDVVLLDVQLPDGNGLEYLHQFKNTPGGRYQMFY